MCIRDRIKGGDLNNAIVYVDKEISASTMENLKKAFGKEEPVSYTHLRAHETVLDLVCRLLLEKKKQYNTSASTRKNNKHTNTHR